MTTRSRSVLRDALPLMTARFVAEQIGLALLVFGLFVLWLRVPDETVLELAASAALGLLVLAVGGSGEALFILRLTGREITAWRLIRGALLVLAAAGVWCLWAKWIGRQVYNDSLAAGYLYSRLPHGLRHFLPYARILLSLEWMWSALAWIGAGVLAAVFVLAAAARPLRAAMKALRSLSFWLVLLAGPTVAAICSNALLRWAPVHGLRPELIGLGVRLTAVVLLDAAATCCLLATIAVCVRRADGVYSPEGVISAGGPEESQPRTADAP